MAENTFSPRLRNSSINGSRFNMELDAVVKKHLAELDRILSLSAFTERKSKSGYESEKDKKEFEEAAEAAKGAENEAMVADNAASELERKAGLLKGESLELKKIREALSPEEKKSKGNTLEKEEQIKHEAWKAAENVAKIKREHAGSVFEIYQLKRKASDHLAKTLSSRLSLPLSSGVLQRRIQFDLEEDLTKPIIAKRTKSPVWDNTGILAEMIDKEDQHLLSISDCIDKVNELSNLKNSLLQYVNKNWNSLEENQRAVLNANEFKNVTDYLLAYGYWIKGITEVSAMFNFIKGHKYGAKAITGYVTISAARAIIKKRAFEIKDIDDDNNPLIKKILDSNVSFNDETFSNDIEKIFKTYIDSDREMALISGALRELKIGEDELPSSYYPAIIRYMRSSKVEIDEFNINYFLPIFINKIKGEVYQEMEDTVEEAEVSDEDFDVEFPEDEKTTIKTNESNVKCASQLFSAAIMETELDIFNLTNFLTNSYLIRNRIDLEDNRLRQNLQTFVFSNRFVNGKTGQVMDRTKEGERQHFYRQVFNIGNGPLPEGVIVNQKFPKLWKQLIPAVKEYLDNSASSLSENTFVSKGGVMQVVSGLQNNLSANCTSMAKIISPIINAEWNFIISKILGHPEIIKQVSPSVGSWKGVAETLFGEMKHSYTDASLVYDKVKLSNAVLRKIATYDPRVFEDEDTFMDFCSMIIQLDDLNNSIAMESMGNDETDINTIANQYAPKTNGQADKSTQPANDTAGDWDF